MTVYLLTCSVNQEPPELVQNFLSAEETEEALCGWLRGRGCEALVGTSNLRTMRILLNGKMLHVDVIDVNL